MHINNKYIGLFSLRFISVVLIIFFNFFIIKYFDNASIGLYYLIITISYLGNALIFVGADLYMQRQLSYISNDFSINKHSLAKYIALSSIVGLIIIAISSGIYFSHLPSREFSVIRYILVCCFLSISLYYVNLAKNIFQLANRQYVSSFFQIFDGCTRFFVFYCVYLFLGSDNETVIYALTFYSILLVIASLSLVFNFIKNNHDRVWDRFERTAITSRILPIGLSGITNWVQLQSYRPYLASMQMPKELGITSYVTNLSSTATAAILSVINQLAIPKIYQSQGEYIRIHVKIILSICVVLSILSIPAGYVFFKLAGNETYMHYIFILPVGVVQEGANALIGSYTHVYNIQDRKLAIFMQGSSLGAVLMLISLLYHYLFGGNIIGIVCLAIMLSQIVVCAYIIFKAHSGNHINV